MLGVTGEAAREILGLLEQGNMAGDGGLRIAANPDGDLTLALAAAPAEDDQVVEASGTRVFMDVTAARALDGQVLDASPSPADGQVRFSVATAP